MNVAFVLPQTALVGMSVFDLDGGPSNEYTESVTASNYAYYVTPLRAASGAQLNTTVDVDRRGGIFTSTAIGTSIDNPSDPNNLTIEQALADFRATWIVLVGDEVVTSSRDRETMPTRLELGCVTRTDCS